MEPVTHMLTGACLSRALGLPAKARYATAACVIAAEIPDADYVYRLGGPLVYFQHHRGWTHAFWSLPLQAALVTAAFFLLYQFQHRRPWRRRTDAPTNWPLVFGACLLALVSHILLDWTNNYGVRPFAPWNPRWYEGDLVFIVEPLLLLFLGGALVLPLLFSLINREIGFRRTRYAGGGLALIALFLTAGLWAYRFLQHGNAEQQVRQQDDTGGTIRRMVLNPYPINPFHWYVVTETATTVKTGSFDNRIRSYDTDTTRTLSKPPVTPAVQAAKQSWLGRVYLDWSRCPMVEDRGTVEQLHPELDLDPQERTWRVIRFTDLRFSYPILGRSDSTALLSAEAWVDNTLHVQRVFFGSAEQKLP
ncbi:MAG TPA: metal-dependent hydrolase [Terriglobus sp.]